MSKREAGREKRRRIRRLLNSTTDIPMSLSNSAMRYGHGSGVTRGLLNKPGVVSDEPDDPGMFDLIQSMIDEENDRLSIDDDPRDEDYDRRDDYESSDVEYDAYDFLDGYGRC